MNADSVISEVRAAFADAVYPGDEAIIDNDAIRDEEVLAVEEAFRGQTDWRALPEAALSVSYALSCLSDPAFRFFLPAFLVADLESPMEFSDPVVHLTYDFQDENKDVVLRLAREFRPPGVDRNTTLFEWGERRCGGFTQGQCRAIVSYLTLKAELDSYSRDAVEEALLNYWWSRAGID